MGLGLEAARISGRLRAPGVPQLPLLEGVRLWEPFGDAEGVVTSVATPWHPNSRGSRLCGVPEPHGVPPRCSEEVKTPGEEVSKAKVHYNVEFTFDTDARVAITIYYQASEEFHNGVAR